MFGDVSTAKENSPFVPVYEETRYVNKLPTCHFCCEQAVLQTESEPYTDICSIINHSDYADIPMVRLKEKE